MLSSFLYKSQRTVLLSSHSHQNLSSCFPKVRPRRRVKATRIAPSIPDVAVKMSSVIPVIKIMEKLLEVALLLPFTGLADLLKPFGENLSSYQPCFMVFIMISIYFAVNGVLLNQKFPGWKVVNACFLVAFIGLIASFTLLTSAILPSNLKCLPWVLFAFTVGVGTLVFLADDVKQGS